MKLTSFSWIKIKLLIFKRWWSKVLYFRINSFIVKTFRLEIFKSYSSTAALKYIWTVFSNTCPHTCHAKNHQDMLFPRTCHAKIICCPASTTLQAHYMCATLNHAMCPPPLTAHFLIFWRIVSPRAFPTHIFSKRVSLTKASILIMVKQTTHP